MPPLRRSASRTRLRTRRPARPADGLASAIAYLTRVLKTPTIGRCWEQLADHAREENWSHEEYSAAVLQRQVAERESADCCPVEIVKRHHQATGSS